ncbi:MAG: hypothetical protein IAE82_13260 [Opitutaceae bacterium]|nr:hypothetical protein [Opitutaceae bacterium]
MQAISRKKQVFPINPDLRRYLARYRRETRLPVVYNDLVRFNNTLPLLDREGRDTHWETTFYDPYTTRELHAGLTEIYALLRTGGDMNAVKHLYVERIDYCVFGNTKPFRVRVVNQYNDNADHFYVKRADASRIYGLELEDLLSPNHMTFFVCKDTLIEEHITGIPGDRFIADYMDRPNRSRVRLAKEFIKFNERCFVRLLGDMRSYNYVIAVTPDFEDEQYRVRPIDFDQQSYEGRKNVYLPQFFKDNIAVVKLCTSLLNLETMRQYQQEERTLMARRFTSARPQLEHLVGCMSKDPLSTPEKIAQLSSELGDYHQSPKFSGLGTMGEILWQHVNACLTRASI